jgi:transglutaminase-like putative cysteine protease
MRRFKILHRTYYNFSGTVRLGPHVLRLRPKENHDLRIESASLDITPAATLRWHNDVEDNTVAIATFDNTPTQQLVIESEVIVQQFNESPLDFLVDGYAANYPFAYGAEDKLVLAPYLLTTTRQASDPLAKWVANLWRVGEPIQTYALLRRLCVHINQSLAYQAREQPGVQTPADTLLRGSGSCRDFAYFFMEAARHLGLAARFVSGYLYAEPSAANYGSTHAWAEVFLPGVGWKGFDPTIGKLVGTDHTSVAVARLPESVPPVAGSFVGPLGANLDVGVWVTELSKV